MFKPKCLLLCFLCYIVLPSNADYVTFVKLCPKGDNACVKSTAQATVPYVANGVPELRLKPVDPLVIDKVDYDEGNLKMTFTNNHIAGPKNCKILDVELDIDQGTFKLDVETPLDITGQYDLHGKILFIEALGNGDYTLHTDKVVIMIKANIKTIEKNGHKFWKPTKVDYTYDLVEKVHMNLTNLFGGDNAAAEPFRKLIDEQWKDVIGELGDPIIRELMGAYVEHIEEFLLKLPIEEVAN